MANTFDWSPEGLVNNPFMQGFGLMAAQALNPNWAPIAQYGMNTLGAKSQANMWQKILGQLMGAPGAKTTIGDGKMTWTGPIGSFASQAMDDAAAGAGPGWKAQKPQAQPIQGTGQQPVAPDQSSMLPSNITGALMAGYLNPSVGSLDISSADLAGLTPQNVSQALNDAMNFSKTAREPYAGAADIMYKGAMIQEVQNRTNAYLAGQNVFPIPVPGVGFVSADQWHDLPDVTRAYAAYAYQQQMAGQPVAPFAEYKQFSNVNDTIQLLEYLDANPDKLELWLKGKEAGAMKFTPYERTEQTKKAEAIASVKDPKWASKMKKDVREYNKLVFEDPLTDPVLAQYLNESYPNASDEQKIARGRELLIINYADAEVQAAAMREFGKEAKWEGDGWYVDGKLFVRSPIK